MNFRSFTSSCANECRSLPLPLRRLGQMVSAPRYRFRALRALGALAPSVSLLLSLSLTLLLPLFCFWAFGASLFFFLLEAGSSRRFCWASRRAPSWRAATSWPCCPRPFAALTWLSILKVSVISDVGCAFVFVSSFRAPC